MRYLLKLELPQAAIAAAGPGLDSRLGEVFRRAGAQAAYATTQEGRRIDWAVIEIAEPAQITPIARFLFDTLKVKPEFLAEVVPPPYFGRKSG